MITGFFNGLGAVFVINLLAWLQLLAIGMFVFGAIYGFVFAIRVILTMHY